MPQPEDPAEHALVLLALQLASRFRNYCEWQQKAALRVLEELPLGLTPEAIKALLLEHVLVRSGEIVQVPEKRNEYRHRKYYYKVIVPFKSAELFVELVLLDDDPTDPSVNIVNAHRQGR